jgi:hypothetical protein
MRQSEIRDGWKVKGGSFRSLEDVLQKLTEESPFFVKCMKLKVDGLKALEDGTVEIKARRCLAQGGNGVWGLRGTRNVNIKTIRESYFRTDDRETVFFDRYILVDYKIDPNAPALPPKPETPKTEKSIFGDLAEKKVREMLGKPDFVMAVESLVNHLNENYKNQSYKVQQGKRYTKIMRIEKDGSEGVWGFIDQNGDILKPATSTAPAKHARGSIYNRKSWNGFSYYGPPYL